MRRLRLEVGLRVDGLLVGESPGVRPGPGTDADRLRPYTPGDDVRRIDWAVTARTGQAASRTSVAEHELEVTLVVDMTPSMNFGTVQRTKGDLAEILIAAVAHLSRSPGSRLGGVLVSSEGIRRVPAGATELATERLLRAVRTATPVDVSLRPAQARSAGDPLALALTALSRSQHRKGLLVVFTDLVDSEVATPGRTDPLARPLRALSARHDVLVVELLDPREMELPDVGHLHLIDPESGSALHINTSNRRLRTRYAEAAKERRGRRRAVVRAAGAENLVLSTDGDWLRDLARHLVLRRRAKHLYPRRRLSS